MTSQRLHRHPHVSHSLLRRARHSKVSSPKRIRSRSLINKEREGVVSIAFLEVLCEKLGSVVTTGLLVLPRGEDDGPTRLKLDGEEGLEGGLDGGEVGSTREDMMGEKERMLGVERVGKGGEGREWDTTRSVFAF
jgi:hypothetical protein